MCQDIQQYKGFLKLSFEKAKTGCTNYIKREWRLVTLSGISEEHVYSQHFIQTTKCSQENSVIFTMDNHPIHSRETYLLEK